MKKIIQIIIFLFTLNVHSYAQEKIHFSDDFDDNSSNWQEMDNNNVLLDIDNGKFMFYHKRDELAYVNWKEVNIDTNRDFKISCNTLWLSGIETYGYELVFGLKDSENFFAFGVSASGFYRYRMIVFGQSKDIITWTKSSSINKNGSNKIAIVKKKSVLEFYINGVKVNKYSFDSFFGDKIGFCVGSKQTILFDDLQVAYLEEEGVFDNTPPQIIITYPDARDFNPFEQQKQVTITGKVTDDIGVYEVRANGFEANLQANGNFSVTVPLKIGNNTIKVIASDTRMNSTTKEIVITRKAEPLERSNEKRLALVIGNATYKNANLLFNTINDARSIAQFLRDNGFEVLLYENLTDKHSCEQAIIKFGSKLKGYDVGIFYYSGHGIQVNGNNYFVPTNVTLNSEQSVPAYCVDMNSAIAEMNGAGCKYKIAILDACRDNPFEKSWGRKNIDGHTKGLAQIRSSLNTVILYATETGKTASDNPSGENGLFTQSLLVNLKKDLPFQEVIMKTTKQVSEQSNFTQIPWSSGTLLNYLYLKR